MEDALVTSRAFTLPGKKKLQTSDYQIEVVVVDVTETPIERPQKNIHQFYSGKKIHTYIKISSCGKPSSLEKSSVPHMVKEKSMIFASSKIVNLG